MTLKTIRQNGIVMFNHVTNTTWFAHAHKINFTDYCNIKTG